MDNHTSPENPLGPLLDDDTITIPANQDTSASLYPFLDISVLSRRRRTVARPNPSGLDARAAPSRASGPNFNPEAIEFVPTGRMPPKRKASTSSRSAVKLSSPRSSSSTSDYPVLSAETLFGRDVLRANSENLENLLSEDDEEQSEIFELELQDARANNQQPGNGIQHERLQETLYLMRTQAEKIKKFTDGVQYQSAILFTQDNSGLRESSPPLSDASRAIRYLPLCPVTASYMRDGITKDTELTVLPSHRERIANSAQITHASRATWPSEGYASNPLPLEIFDIITDFLSRDDIKSMRLVNREFETKVSATLFWSSVVPFNTELYDMVDEYRPLQAARLSEKGKGKARAPDLPSPAATGLNWHNAKEDAQGKMYKGHGLRVFQGFGPHIKRFGMSFEVAEAQLARPPIKKELDFFHSYHGPYAWPPQQYTRFANLAGLERTADETLRMKAAFANLHKVQDLALSLDSGLGWLNGPDKSIHARIFQRPTPVFGQSRSVPDQQMQEAKAFWNSIQSCHRSLGINFDPKEVSLARRMLTKPPAELSGLQGTRYADPKHWLSIVGERTAPAIFGTNSTENSRYGVLYTTFNQPKNSAELFDKSTLMPVDLRKEQKEWLMETDWAQRAFLECYMLAITDNPLTFARVKSLTIAKVSSGLLPILARESFWDALPGLSDVTIHVKPDWRAVEKDNAGFAEACSRMPSDAVNVFHKSILRDRICLRSSITKLNIGWVGGGEHAEGIFARNNHLLPAPIMPLEYSTAITANFGLVFKFVKHLTLTNCWMTPLMLQELVSIHAEKNLKTLTLDSVSLTAHPKFPAGAQAGINQQIAQAIVAAQNGQQPALPGLNAGNPPQGLLANMQQWLNNPGPNFGAGHLQQLLHQHAQQWGLLAQMPAPVQPVQALQPQPAVQQNIQQAVAANSAAAAHWTANHREGSWPELINKISPGRVFSDFLPQPAPWEEQLPERRRTNLRTIEFKSCGYAKLINNNSFDQFAIEAGHDHHFSTWFRSRLAALTPAMMSTNDRYFGRIVQRIPEAESNALLLAWGFNEHLWSDGAEEPEYDGFLPGGTGRFSGRIDADTSNSAAVTSE
ncbi:uncharacterized protein MYCFIDRAFT_77467 [Pseudocercospora fijiensis CIRAD86]|uniref:F-box domain-containing protein n=1 Tax=Pseudocercospora fijiensis (strain CIRAD86) TaxID=383855 RepID=M3A6H9_PSEFD|nr:uncharacterized protein MYCFIDRAFT_77467 [Pseudocercospora fijiensis CIRAD86]EME86704.1 hypothetical protein MYCFIDRAFT_77467 [Pseudocercospora fijiensis CIRAD86]